jgi:DNA-binding transcriptional LysR family regulator
MSKLDPLSLRLFVSVVTLKSIAAASERHHIAATAVSKRISDLERTLGIVLLSRTNRGVEATEAGSALFSLAQGALNELERIPMLMHNFCAGGQGVVRVSASTSAMSQFLSDDLLDFIETNPGIQLQIGEDTSESVVQAVRENAVDLGVFTNSYNLEGLSTESYHQDRLVLVCPTSHLLTERESWRFEDTLEHDYIGWFGGSAVNKQLNAAALMSQALWKVRVRVSSFDATCKMVERGLGIGILPENVARQRSHSFDIAIRQLEDDWTVRHFYLAYRDKDSLAPHVRLLLDYLVSKANREAS